MVPDIFIHETASIKDALKMLDKTAKKALVVVDKGTRFLGILTDGDIRRYILSNKDLENGVKEAYNKRPISIRKEKFSPDAARKIMLENRIEMIPILDDNDKVTECMTWDELFSGERGEYQNSGKIDIPVVIMAGGMGERMEPFTRILPKALIPIDDKPIIEIIIDGFRAQGASEFYLILNHKRAMIESYFNDIKKDYDINFIREEKFLGTAGGLKLLKERIHGPFIVSNCDVIVKADFGEVIKLHNEEKASLTILSSMQHHKIPYGVVKFKDGGEVLSIQEKPEYTVTVNAGVYVLQKDALAFISDEPSFDMTDLIRKLIENNKKVVTYPVNEHDYIDIGQWEEYKKSIDYFHKRIQI